MNVSFIVASYGDEQWRRQGDHAAELVRSQGPAEVIRLHSEDATLAQVRNAAASDARSDWLCFVDADDGLAPGYLDRMREAFEAWDVHQYRGNMDAGLAVYPNVLLVPSVQYVRSDGTCLGPLIPQWDEDLYQLNCAVIGTLVPRRMFMKVGWFHEFAIYEDWDLWLRCVRAGAHMLPVREAVYCAQTRSSSRNNQDAQLATNVYAAIRERHADVDQTVWDNAKIKETT